MKVFVVVLELDKNTVDAVPELNSIALVFARPISKLGPPEEVNTVPLELCVVSTNLKVLNA